MLHMHGKDLPDDKHNFAVSAWLQLGFLNGSDLQGSGHGRESVNPAARHLQPFVVIF